MHQDTPCQHETHEKLVGERRTISYLLLLFQFVGRNQPLPHRHLQGAQTALDIHAEMACYLKQAKAHGGRQSAGDEKRCRQSAACRWLVSIAVLRGTIRRSGEVFLPSVQSSGNLFRNPRTS